MLEQICEAAQGVRQEQKILEKTDNIWKILQRYKLEDTYYIELILKYTLSCFMISLPQEKKNYLFKILLVYQQDQSEY